MNATERTIRKQNGTLGKRPRGPFTCCATDSEGESVAEWYEDTLELAGKSCSAAVKGAGTAKEATAEDANGNTVIVRRRRD